MMYHVDIKFYEKLKFYCWKCSFIAGMKKIDQKIMIFELIIDGEWDHEDSHQKIGIFEKIDPKVPPDLIETPVSTSFYLQ